MTVRELVELLSRQHPDAEVRTWDRNRYSARRSIGAVEVDGCEQDIDDDEDTCAHRAHVLIVEG